MPYTCMTLMFYPFTCECQVITPLPHLGKMPYHGIGIWLREKLPRDQMMQLEVKGNEYPGVGDWLVEMRRQEGARQINFSYFLPLCTTLKRVCVFSFQPLWANTPGKWPAVFWRDGQWSNALCHIVLHLSLLHLPFFLILVALGLHNSHMVSTWFSDWGSVFSFF